MSYLNMRFGLDENTFVNVCNFRWNLLLLKHLLLPVVRQAITLLYRLYARVDKNVDKRAYMSNINVTIYET